MNRYLALALVIALSACSKPTDTVVPTSLDKMVSIKPQMEKLTSEEKDLFSKYLVRHTVGSAMGGMFGIKVDPIPEGITIGKAIDEEREFLKQEGELLKKLLAKREEWQFESAVDKFTDEKKAFASIMGKEDGNEGFINVGCFPSGIEVKVSAGKYIGDKEIFGNVKYRVDSNKYEVATMKPTSKSFVYENGKDSKFLKALMSGKEIIVELTSYDYDTSSASFSLNGAEPAIRKVLSLCQAGVAAKAPENKPALESNFAVHIGAFTKAETAQYLQKKLSKDGFKIYTEKEADKVRVRAGPYATREAAENVRHKLEEQGLHSVIISAP